MVPPSSRSSNRIFWGCALVALGVGFGSALRWRWVCDDAFITFRYVDQLLAGHGLVYNAGERVEGYTHFLWLWLLAAARWLGFGLVGASQALGLAADLATLGLWVLFSRRSFGESARVPMTAVALALHYDVRLWATGGLETACFTLLLSALFITVTLGARSSRGRMSAGVLSALLFLTRPDGALFYPVVLLFLLLRDRSESVPSERVRSGLLWYHLPLVAIVLPYLAWKLAYFGQLLPNTYYAKEGGGSYFSQGFRYLWLYVQAYPTSSLSIVGLPVAVWGLWRGRSAAAPGAAALLAVGMSLVYLFLFVARVGGDFMFARFVLPVVPLLFASTEITAHRLLDQRPRLLVPLLLLLPSLVLLEHGRRDALFAGDARVVAGSLRRSGVADEHWYWAHEENGSTLIERYERIGRRLAEIFEGTDVRVVIAGQASLAYYARFATVIESNGLTDPYVAHLPVEERGRPGHEKVAPLEYLVRRGVHFEFMKRPRSDEAWRQVRFRIGGEWIGGYVITYDAELLGSLVSRFPADVVVTER